MMIRNITPDRIWLLLNEGDEGGHVWCDNPDPSGTGEHQSVEYVRADVHQAELAAAARDELRAERDAALAREARLIECLEIIARGSRAGPRPLAGITLECHRLALASISKLQPSAERLGLGFAQWQPLSALGPTRVDEPVRLFNARWIDEDFNPTGSIEGFWQDEEGWIGAVWNPEQDYWDRQVVHPTHIQSLPRPPQGMPEKT